MERAEGQRHERRGGTVLLLVVISIVALLGVAALATDVGHVWSVRTELQNAADAAALAAAANLIDSSGPSVTLDLARDGAESYGLLNRADQEQIAIDRSADLTFGNWDLDSRILDTSVDLTDPDQVTAVRVDCRKDGVRNQAVPTVLARLIGRDEFQVGATATAYLGFAGSFAPGTVELPIVIDCCAISEGSSCTNVCEYLAANPYPNQALLSDGVTPATKLEFDSTPEQNACWTDFETGSSVSTTSLEGVVDDGNSVQFGVQQAGIQIDNGDKTPVVRMIQERFLGTGDYEGQPQGSDLYDPPAGIDSWVLGLPVIACQTEDHCSGNDLVPIVGAVCFEMREVRVTPEKEILGRFFCPGPDEPLSCNIAGSGSGGPNFGIRAEIPVLVQ